jgi:hypothetical protein
MLLYAVGSSHTSCEEFPFLAIHFQIFLFFPNFCHKIYVGGYIMPKENDNTLTDAVNKNY